MTGSGNKEVTLVRDLMQIGVITCPAETPLIEAVKMLLRERLESLVILDKNGHAAGLLGRREVITAYGRSGATSHCCESLTVAEVMRPDIPAVPPDIPAAAAAQIMLDQGIRDLYLLHHDSGISWPAAVFRFEDVLRHITEENCSPTVNGT